MLLPDQFAKRLRPIPASNDDIFAAGRLLTTVRRNFGFSHGEPASAGGFEVRSDKKTRSESPDHQLRPPVRGPHTKRRELMAAVFPP